MRRFVCGLIGLVLLPLALQAQQPPNAQPRQAPTPGPPIVIYRIDLNPTGSMFAMNEPHLDGDAYVFRSLPERAVTRLPKASVKLIVRRSTDFEKEVIWQIDLNPTGRMLCTMEPALKGSNYVFSTWKTGTLVSMPKSDVLKVTKITGMAAFKVQEEELGVTELTAEPNVGSAPVALPQPPAPPPY